MPKGRRRYVPVAVLPRILFFKIHVILNLVTGRHAYRRARVYRLYPNWNGSIATHLHFNLYYQVINKDDAWRNRRRGSRSYGAAAARGEPAPHPQPHRCVTVCACSRTAPRGLLAEHPGAAARRPTAVPSPLGYVRKVDSANHVQRLKAANHGPDRQVPSTSIGRFSPP
eukprot:SAG31_NODE_2527_length_5558_cov_2.684374_2_plen_169_part_00